MRRPTVVGNWKMNASFAQTTELLAGLSEGWSGVHKAEVAVCPPYPYLAKTAELLEQSNIVFGSQDVSQHESGAYTGQVSADMLLDLGCKYAIVGHSERREYQGESSELVAEKFEAAINKGLTPILCVGETQAERESELTFDVVGQQLRAVIDRCGLEGVAKGVVAYEPVWAIGTGLSATPEMAQDVHAYIREVLGPEGEQTAILYGGSVKPDTAAALFAQQDIDGALVGGASLKVEDFLAICRAAD
ncbi:triose-phosphate isomerase [Agaribacterium sp. ZY112]|uniref:triose-phosphate isomerase n=1 Tax=Agaribacterium sp. ZY112 TaxID=3233574 RepID=UPI00352456CD